MRFFIILLLVFCAQTSFADILYFDLVKIQNLELVSQTEKYILAETSVVRNKAGHSVSLSKIKLPTTVKADVVKGNDGNNIILWMELIDSKNNVQVPE